MTNPTPYLASTASLNPPYLYVPYASTVRRAPKKPLVSLRHTLSEVTGPTFSDESLWTCTSDLTRPHGAKSEAIGQRIIVSGQVFDTSGRPLPRTYVQVWQANAAGRYHHTTDQHDAPLDPSFLGSGAVRTDDEGRYRFVTIEPGCYPWKNHFNAWRPRHIHFSLFGPAFAARLVTQMYFPGDPLLALDPIFNSVPDTNARQRLISKLDLQNAVPGSCMAYRFDIVLRGREETPVESY